MFKAEIRQGVRSKNTKITKLSEPLYEPTKALLAFAIATTAVGAMSVAQDAASLSALVEQLQNLDLPQDLLNDLHEQDQGGSEPREGPEDGSDAQQSRMAANDSEDLEDRQAAEQWLRRIPDDPGGLLRNKFRRQYQRLGVDQDGNSLWPGDEEEPW